MTEGRWRLLRAMLSIDGTGLSPIARVCQAAVVRLGVTGAGITLVDQDQRRASSSHLGYASDEVIARLEELQWRVGEGPGLHASITGVPVLMSGLPAVRARWPAYADLAHEAGVAAVFAFPLSLGSIRLGALVCYRTTAGELSGTQVSDGLILAELGFEAVLAEVAGRDPDDLGWIRDVHVEVHQASGIVMHQLGITMQAALLRIRGYSYANDVPLDEVARQIVARELELKGEQ